MQKIVFITVSVLIIGYVIYMAVMAIIRGKKAKEDQQKKNK